MADADYTSKVESLSSAAENTEATQFQTGQIIEGKYQIVSLLGRGGMGVVYRVKQVFLNKELALKTIETRSLNDTVLRRFQQEAKTSFSLDHPNIIKVNDFGVLEDGSPFLVMELVSGETLAERIKRLGCLSIDETNSIFIQVCFGLAYAHECGIVHRDIKPSNIMLMKGMPLGTEGSVKIVDFGIAKFVSHEGGEIQSLTRTGEIFGSPLYMSPEQCSGSNVDHRSDVYSLGCVMFEALTGTPPFIAENALTTMMKHQSEPTPTLKEAALGAEFPPALEQIVSRMLAKEPDRRYSNLGVLAHDLSALKRGDALSKSSVAAATPVAANTISMPRNTFYALIATILVFSAAAGGAVMHVIESAKRSQQNLQIDAKSLNAPPPTITDVFKDANQQSTVEYLNAQIRSRSKINDLNIAGRIVSDEAIELITTMHELTKIKMEDCKLSNESMYKLNQLNLTNLDLSFSNINDEGILGLSDSETLGEIKADDAKLTERSMKAFSKMKSLHLLSLAKVKVSNEGLAYLAKSKRLDTLDLTGATGFNADGLAELASSKLISLNLSGTEFSPSIMKALCRIKSLRRLRIADTAVTEEDLRKICNSDQLLDYVDVSHCANLAHTQALTDLRTDFPKIIFEDSKKALIDKWQ